MTTLSEHDDEAISELLVGRRIVKAETGSWDRDCLDFPSPGRLTLDDGTEIYVRPNIGGCSCGAPQGDTK